MSYNQQASDLIQIAPAVEHNKNNGSLLRNDCRKMQSKTMSTTKNENNKNKKFHDEVLTTTAMMKNEELAPTASTCNAEKTNIPDSLSPHNGIVESLKMLGEKLNEQNHGYPSKSDSSEGTDDSSDVVAAYYYCTGDSTSSSKETYTNYSGDDDSQDDDDDNGRDDNNDPTKEKSAKEDESGYLSPNGTYQQKQWKSRFQELVKFQEIHGHCNISLHDNHRLRQWMNRQRFQYRLKVAGRKTVLTDERQDLLASIGFFNLNESSSLTAWETWFEVLKDYVKQHGCCEVNPQECPQLFNWMEVQKQQFQLFQKNLVSSTLTQEQIKKLTGIGISWDFGNISTEEISNIPSADNHPTQKQG